MKLFRVLVLTLALSGSVYAGNIQNGIVQPPPSEPTNATHTTTEQTPTVTEILLTVVRVLGLI